MLPVLLLIAAIVTITSSATPGQNRSTARGYQQMSAQERTIFVNERARSLARDISGRDYDFTPAFTAAIQNAVDAYARSIAGDTGQGRGDARASFERGQTYAPAIAAIFKAREVSPLIGLYLPVIESAYVNIEKPNAMRAVGLFQFLPQTGRRYGLAREELLNVEKSADAAARYILDNLELFKNDPMKEALALLAYNRGEQRVVADLALVLNDQNAACSICAITEAGSRLDKTFQAESVYYVPMFFAAAIVGENPDAFGLKTPALSSYITR
jgi:hypothetical protein